MITFFVSMAVFDFVYFFSQEQEISIVDNPGFIIYPAFFIIGLSILMSFWVRKCDWMDTMFVTISALAGFVFEGFISDSIFRDGLFKIGFLGWMFGAAIFSLIGFFIGRLLRKFFRKNPIFRLVCSHLGKKIS